MDEEIKPVEEIEPVKEVVPTEVVQPVEVTQPTEEIKTFEPVKPIEKVKLEKSAKRSFLRLFFDIILILILTATSAGAAYWWRDKTANEFEGTQATEIASFKTEIISLKSQLAEAKAKTATYCDTEECIPISPSASVIENIKASITSGNTAALEGYMADQVTVILAATEGIGSQTPTQAVSDITSFISDATSPWDFLLAASVLSSYGQGGYDQYFTNIDTVGKSADGKVISFSFDCDAKISTVFMAASDELLQ